jgi:hypothetical protein
MRKRLVWLVVALLCIGLVAVFAGWFAQRGHRIDRFATERIKVGMTEDEVVRIVGMLPDDYRTAAAQEERSRCNTGWGRGLGCPQIDDVSDQLVYGGKPFDISYYWPKFTSRQWLTNLQVLHVIFDDRGTVAGWIFRAAGKDEDTSFEKLRRRLSF